MRVQITGVSSSSRFSGFVFTGLGCGTEAWTGGTGNCSSLLWRFCTRAVFSSLGAMLRMMPLTCSQSFLVCTRTLGLRSASEKSEPKRGASARGRLFWR